MRTWKQETYEQIKQQIVHAVALGPLRKGQHVKNVLYMAARENGPSWSLWQKNTNTTAGLLELEIKRISDLLHSTWKRDAGSLWNGLSCFKKWFPLKHSLFWHLDRQCRVGCSKGTTLAHITPLMLPSGLHYHTPDSNRKSQLPRDLGNYHYLAWRWKFRTIIKGCGGGVKGIICWGGATSYLKIKSNTLSSLTHSICIVGINWKCESCYMDSYAMSCRNN